MNGTLLCTKYAFPPNYFHYCGPDENDRLGEYLVHQDADPKPRILLKEFQTLYSYLDTIAQANHIVDPLDARVVHAYWIGNQLLEKLSPQQTYLGLTEGQHLDQLLPQVHQKWLYPKVEVAKLHHSFHVMNVFLRTGHLLLPITVESMDNCRIGWGKILKIDKNKLTLNSQQIILKNGKLTLKENVKRSIQTPTTSVYNIGEMVSYHWNWACDKLTASDIKNLKYYTTLSLNLANTTI